ncbi:MAG: helix-turn-helix transcriptional regulator [Gordonibacter sp.]|uniref:helix-turn-helix domain-containing protein n=1 Tax=Gordonibacter sp. TaxID=1968902 RepID=UPI002FC6CC30
MQVKRTEARMGRKELAKKSGMSEQTIGKYERGEMMPLLETVCVLAVALDSTPNELCGWPAIT